MTVNEDFAATPLTVNLNAASNPVDCITVTIVADGVQEGDEIFFVSATTSEDQVTLSPSVTTVTIIHVGVFMCVGVGVFCWKLLCNPMYQVLCK